MDEEALMKVVAEQSLAEAKLKKSKNKPRIQKCAKINSSQVEEKDSTSESVDIVCADASLTSLHSPVAKKQKTTVTMTVPEISMFTLEYASANSIALANSLSSSVTYHAKDPKKLSKMSSISCGEEVRAFASQLYLWSLEQEKKSQLELARLPQLEKAADAAEDRATDEMQKTARAEEKLAKLEVDAKAVAIREKDLKEKISTLERELHIAKQAQVNAEAKWLRVGLNRRLDMVKAANLDFKKCLYDYELEVLALEEADDDDDGVIDVAEPREDDADPSKILKD